MDKVNILGLNISKISQGELLNKVNEYLNSGKQHIIVTPNPEIMIAACGHDEELFYIINKADLALADGVALKFAGWAAGENLRRVTGADLLKDILALAEKKDKSAAVFSWSRGLSGRRDIERALAEKYPRLRLLVIETGRQAELPEPELAAAREFKPEIIFSALGAPWQEKFIFHNLSKLPTAKIGLAVGGSFDFLTGKLPRAPLWLRKIGLEWLWRLSWQPKRWRRIYKAVIVFPCKFFVWSFVLRFFYRPNVACLLFRQKNGRREILIVERVDEPGHWQLPQGGIDGEDLMTAGRRELSEEINTDKFRSVAALGDLYRYEFGEAAGQHRTSDGKIRGYKGQKQGLFIAEFRGHDADIRVNFWEHSSWRWVEAEKLVEAVHPVRRAAARVFMKKF